MLKRLKKLVEDEVTFREKEKQSKIRLDEIVKGQDKNYEDIVKESLIYFTKAESYDISSARSLEYLKALYLVNLALYHQNERIIKLLKSKS